MCIKPSKVVADSVYRIGRRFPYRNQPTPQPHAHHVPYSTGNFLSHPHSGTCSEFYRYPKSPDLNNFNRIRVCATRSLRVVLTNPL